MPAASPPRNEIERLKALRSYNILDTLPETEFDNIVKLASSICNTPIALVSLVDENRQWFKAKTGLEANETHRDLAFCAHAILNPNEPLIVEDATQDKRFSDNDLVTGQPEIRFYAGYPLNSPSGHSLGTLCAIDTQPRKISEEQKNTLKTLASHVVHLLELKKSRDDLLLERERLSLAEKEAQVGHWEVDLLNGELFWSDQVYEIHGVTPDIFSPNVDDAIDFYHPEDQDLVKGALEELIATQKPFSFEARVLTKIGEERYVSAKGHPRINTSGEVTGIFGIFQDITDSQKAATALTFKTSLLAKAESVGKVGHWKSNILNATLFWSPETFKIHGVSPQNYNPTPESAMGFYHPDDVDRVKKILDNAREELSEFSFEARIVRPNEEIVYVQSQGECGADKSGQLTEIFGTFQDVTAQKLSELALQESKERYELAVTGSSVGLWDWNIRTNELYWSPRFKRNCWYHRHRICAPSKRI